MIIFLDQHCSGGQGARKKARGEVPSDIFCIAKQTKKQQNEVFFQVVLARNVAPFLSSLYNSCITQGKWPIEWKKGEWAPVHKKADKDVDENYRPITVLNAVDKVFEKELSKQVTDSFDSKLSPCLTAYKKHNSKETTLLRLIKDWKLAFDKGEITAILSTHMSKAFDSMVPSLLLKKFESYGLSEGSLRLITSYFEERQNRVKLGNIRSE